MGESTLCALFIILMLSGMLPIANATGTLIDRNPCAFLVAAWSFVADDLPLVIDEREIDAPPFEVLPMLIRVKFLTKSSSTPTELPWDAIICSSFKHSISSLLADSAA